MDKRKRRIKNCRSRRLVFVSPKLKQKCVSTKQTIERSKGGLAEKSSLKKQRVSLMKSSALK